MSVYSAKLSKPQWQKKRLECFEKAGWKCEKCGCSYRTLHLHHPEYDGGYKKNPWEYDGMVVLCSKCHKAEHPELKIKKLEIGKFYKFPHKKTVFRCVNSDFAEWTGRVVPHLEASDGEIFAWLPTSHSPYMERATAKERLKWYEENMDASEGQPQWCM